jgi:hypothetical protein
VLIFVGVTTAIALLYIVLFRFALRSIVASLAKVAGGRGVGHHTLVLSPNGIREVGPSAEHAHAWTALQNLEEGPDHFFLLVGFGMAYVVPKRALPERAALQQFRETVARYRASGPTTG